MPSDSSFTPGDGWIYDAEKNTIYGPRGTSMFVRSDIPDDQRVQFCSDLAIKLSTVSETTEYICKCGIRVTPHKCTPDTTF